MSYSSATLCSVVLLCVVHAVAVHGSAQHASTQQITAWQMASSADVKATGEAISLPTFKPEGSGWLPVTAPATVITGLVQNSVPGYTDLFYGTNLKSVSTEPFMVPWWFRAQFTVPSGSPLARLTFKGLNYKADVYVNGKQVGNSSVVVGPFRYFDFDITSIAAPEGGANAVAVLCWRPKDSAFPPTNNDTDLAISFVDWAPPAPDNNMGLWREVELATPPGEVTVRYPQVTTVIKSAALPATTATSDGTEVALTVLVELCNHGAAEATGVLQASLPGVVSGGSVQQAATVAAGACVQATLIPEDHPGLTVSNPAMWWPWNLGTPTLHPLTVSFTAHGAAAAFDAVTAQYGIRTASSYLNGRGYRQYTVNGRPVLILGAGWAPDLFQRTSWASQTRQFAYVRQMGMNAVRLEGKMQPDGFFDAADQAGVLTLPGWCCCDAWQHWSYWGPEQYTVAVASLRDQVKRLRIHPSVAAFWYSSDQMPPAKVEQDYLQVFSEEKWPNALLASASNLTSTISGDTGVKMSGPYAYVPPSYWTLSTPGLVDMELGGGYGFLTEGGPGASPMLLASLEEFLTPDSLWPIGDDWDWHCGNQVGLFGNLRFFTPPLYGRYATATSAAMYAYMAQVASYETHRAMYEAYGRNGYPSVGVAEADAEAGVGSEGVGYTVAATGMILWMLNSATPSNMWNAYDPSLRTGGAFFGIRKANEPLHAMFGYDDGAMWVVNPRDTETPADLKFGASIWDVNGTMVWHYSNDVPIIPAFFSASLVDLALPKREDLTTATYLIRLVLRNSTNVDAPAVSESTYWWSTTPDEMDFAGSNFYRTPITKYADLSGLMQLPPVQLHTTYTTSPSPVPTVGHGGQGSTAELAGTGGDGMQSYTTTVRLANPSTSIAFAVQVRVIRNGTDVTPALWSDNYVTVYPSENATVAATYEAPDDTATVEVRTWNAVVAGSASAAPTGRA